MVHRKEGYLDRNSPKILPHNFPGYLDRYPAGSGPGNRPSYQPRNPAHHPPRNGGHDSAGHLRDYKAHRPPDFARSLVPALEDTAALLDRVNNH